MNRHKDPRPGESVLARILREWTDPGPAPESHRAWQDRLRQEWPTLTTVLDVATRTGNGGSSRA